MIHRLNFSTDRSICVEVFCKKGVLRNFVKFTKKTPVLEFLLNKVAGKTLNFIKKGLQHRCFAMNFVKFFKNTYLVKSMRMATSGWINSLEISKWLLYTYNHIFCCMLRRLTPMLSFFPVSLYTSDFKFHVQGYILIKSISCSFSTEVIS